MSIEIASSQFSFAEESLTADVEASNLIEFVIDISFVINIIVRNKLT